VIRSQKGKTHKTNNALAQTTLVRSNYKMDLPIDRLNDKINSQFSKLNELIVGGKGGFEFIRVDLLAQHLDTSEAGLRFFLGVVSGVPFAIIYLFLSKLSANNKHLYFTITGLMINYFCFGSDCIYNLFSIFVSYVSLVTLGATLNNVIFSFIFHTIYLSVGYYINATDNYDVKWTTPQCILCLRLIGLAWDVYDGQQKEETLSADQLDLCIKENPSFMEIFGFSFCFCGFLGGPQFSLKRYIRFTNNSLIPSEVKTASRFVESLKRFVGAIIMTAIYSTLDAMYRPEDLLKQEFLVKSFYQKVLQMGFVYYSQFLKYVVVWWFSESTCMFVGLSFNGVDKDGKPSWIGLRNFKFRQFITGTFFQDIIESFNINTNQWVGRYLFKRLRFLGNKNASHAITLLYLSVWHGFYIGYLIMFILEFTQVTAERQYRNAFSKYFNVQFNELSLIKRIPLQLLGAFYKFLACGFYVQSFMILRWRKIKIVYASVYWWPVVVAFVWFFVLGPFMQYLNKQKSSKTERRGDEISDKTKSE